MANSFIKANKIAPTALGLLEREIILPALVWRDAGGSFVGAAGDTISIRVPARTTARTRTLRGTRGTASEGEGIIQMDSLTEHKVDVTLDEDIYNAVPITDEELTLDISDFGAQILAPQVRAVAEGLENKLAATMLDATYKTSIPLSPAAVYDGMVDARKALNVANVPMNDRIVVLGAGMEAMFLKDDHLNKVDQSGSDSALRDATIGRIAGFGLVVVSNALPEDVGFAFHRTAYVLSMQAPAVPSGATDGASTTYQGLAMRVLRDYDLRNLQDRQVVDVYAGTNIVADGPTNEVQTVTITGGPTGGNFKLTYGGQQTGNIAYNATAAHLKAALAALNNLDAAQVDVSLATNVYTVTFKVGADVPQMTADGTGLTGGSSPAVAVATSAAGASIGSFVRAVKLTMGS